MNYNLLNYPGTDTTTRNPYFRTTIAAVILIFFTSYKSELKKIFHRIQQPIKIVVLNYEETDWDDTNVNLLVGLISDGK
jgi:hypothetical protein